MECILCGNVLSGLAAGLGSLIAFVVFPVTELMLGFFGFIIDKVLALKND